MLRLTLRQREMLIDKVPDLANLGAAGLVFGQAFMESFSVVVGLAGVLMWVMGVGFAAFIGRRDA